MRSQLLLPASPTLGTYTRAPPASCHHRPTDDKSSCRTRADATEGSTYPPILLAHGHDDSHKDGLTTLCKEGKMDSNTVTRERKRKRDQH